MVDLGHRPRVLAPWRSGITWLLESSSMLKKSCLMELRLCGNKAQANAVWMHTVRHHNKHSALCATASDWARTIVSQDKRGFKQQRHSEQAAMCLQLIQRNWEGLKGGAQGIESPSERGYSSLFEHISLYSCWSRAGNYRSFTTVDLGALLLAIFGAFFPQGLFLEDSTLLWSGLSVCGLSVW